MMAKRWAGLLAVLLLLTACREVRIQALQHGTTTVLGSGKELLVVRDIATLERLGIKAPVRFRNEFAVVLLLGPHTQTGYRQIQEYLSANADRARVVLFEEAPLDGGEPSRAYRTYSLWIVPNSAYRRGYHVEVVTPSNQPVIEGTLP
ncbi:MAG TPA: hypothetical protein VHT53_04915 [Candidatus Elarobacter sp.]|jgi:hypothetical protein|nr:hypothetical protein [Candidatus Elarobacter sp.]